MLVEKVTLDNDSAGAVGAEAVAEAALVVVNWVDNSVDCRIVVDLWFSSRRFFCMNQLHYSHLCCNFGFGMTIAHCFLCCCSFPPFFRYRIHYCTSCMCNRSMDFAEH